MSVLKLESILNSLLFSINFSWFYSAEFICILALMWILLIKKMGLIRSLFSVATAGIAVSNLWIWLSRDKSYISVLLFFIISSIIVIYFVYVYTLKEE